MYGFYRQFVQHRNGAYGYFLGMKQRKMDLKGTCQQNVEKILYEQRFVHDSLFYVDTNISILTG